jgi:histidine triad (HIT) family protein
MTGSHFSRLTFELTRWIARSHLGQALVYFLIRFMSFIIPTQKLRQTATVLAFYHPKPAYRVHILIVPRRAIPGLQALKPTDQGLIQEIFQTAQSLAEELSLQECGYRLVVNGGAYQEFPLLHFHLISE